ncbi:16S rRNA (cytosine1402-N4)-methyltransferase [Micrococcales bacterium KH10]|nr:16S rRNA (cytosine1402-N4)-methyltransferase [Micrococcales bacterium KH10]
MASSDETSVRHIPVLLEPTVELLTPALDRPSPVLVDGTTGLGGHSEAFLNRFADLTVVGIDRDTSALELASRRLAGFGNRFRPVHTTYDNIDEALAENNLSGADAILLDLGVSSMQIDERERGFAYSQDAPLDMRMDRTTSLTAADVLNEYEPEDLIRILRTYGEERFAQRIVQRIVRRRAQRPWHMSGELVELIHDAVPAASRRTGGNPAKRTFQALRIEVNGELRVLEATMPTAIAALRTGGRIAVMSYHSLEDRIVKRAFAAGSHSRTPRGLPVEIADDQPYLELVTRGAIKASDDEILTNSRAASVRLRVAQRIRDTASVRESERTRR